MTLNDDRYDTATWGEQLRAWREDVKHWTRTDLRDQVEAASYRLKEQRGHLLDTKLIGRWETGKVKSPQPVYLRILASLGAPVPAACSVVEQSADEDDDMDRRNFLRSAGVAVAAAVTLPTLSYGGRLVPSRVDPSHLRSIRAAVDALYKQDQRIGGATLANAALAQYYDARQMLDQADYKEDVGRELMSIAGELAVCVGWLSYDAGDQRKARELYAEAFLLADQASDTKLAIQAVEKMALQSVYIAHRGQHRGAAREALRLGGRGVDLARFEQSSRLHALLGGRQALASAVTGDAQEFRVSITRAWREIDRAGEVESDETWLQFVNPSEVAVHEAKGYRYLGEPEKAARLYQKSLLDDRSLSPRNRLNYRAQLAATLATLGDAASATQEGLAVLAELENEVASPRTLAELTSVRKLADPKLHGEFCGRYDRATEAVKA